MQDTIRVSYRETDILKVTRESQAFRVGSRSKVDVLTKNPLGLSPKHLCVFVPMYRGLGYRLL